MRIHNLKLNRLRTNIKYLKIMIDHICTYKFTLLYFYICGLLIYSVLYAYTLFFCIYFRLVNNDPRGRSIYQTNYVQLGI